jgi:hypothetical protein
MRRSAMGEAKRRKAIMSQTVRGDVMTVTTEVYENDLPGFDVGMMIASEAFAAGKPVIGARPEDGTITCPECGMSIVARVNGQMIDFDYPADRPCPYPGDMKPEALKCPAFKPHYMETYERVIAGLADRKRRRGR